LLFTERGWVYSQEMIAVFRQRALDQLQLQLKSKNESDRGSVADPDLNPDPDPHIFGPPGSGSGTFYHHAKIIRKTLIPTVLFCDSF
jgi:hypothetical protein